MKFLLFTAATFFLLPSCNSKVESQQSTILIGEQEWMTTNLEVTHFRNSDSITEVKSSEDWSDASDKKQPAWCYYENDNRKGKLYNWFAVNDKRGLAPEGWHIPNREEWEILASFLIKNNDFYFQQGGFRHLQGNFRLNGSVDYWWSSKEASSVTSWHRQFFEDKLTENNTGKGTGLSVRCIKRKE